MNFVARMKKNRQKYRHPKCHLQFRFRFRGFHRSFNYKRIDISHAYSRTSVRCYFTFKIYNVKFPYIFANALTKTGKQILLLSFHKL